MGTLEFEKDLWAPLQPNELPPISERIGQASGGVMDAVHQFHWAFFSDNAAVHLDRGLEARRVHNLGAKVMTFREEFLHLSRQTVGGFLVLMTEKGGAVKSVDTWDSNSETPQALTREEARARFADLALAVVCDPECVTTYWHVHRPKRPMRLVMERPYPHELDEEHTHQADNAPSEEVLKTRALLKATREALLPENWALRPVASA